MNGMRGRCGGRWSLVGISPNFQISFKTCQYRTTRIQIAQQGRTLQQILPQQWTTRRAQRGDKQEERNAQNRAMTWGLAVRGRAQRSARTHTTTERRLCERCLKQHRSRNAPQNAGQQQPLETHNNTSERDQAGYRAQTHHVFFFDFGGGLLPLRSDVPSKAKHRSHGTGLSHAHGHLPLSPLSISTRNTKREWREGGLTCSRT